MFRTITTYILSRSWKNSRSREETETIGRILRLIEKRKGLEIQEDEGKKEKKKVTRAYVCPTCQLYNRRQRKKEGKKISVNDTITN